MSLHDNGEHSGVTDDAYYVNPARSDTLAGTACGREAAIAAP